MQVPTAASSNENPESADLLGRASTVPEQRMMRPNAPMNSTERVTGALHALACGDALGAPAEFFSQSQLKDRWGVLTEMTGGGTWLPGEWTDDTGMALCVAEGILDEPEDPVPSTGKYFLEWRRTAKDVGSTISAALSAFRGDWPTASRSTPQREAVRQPVTAP